MAFFQPILCKWLDLREYAGTTFSGGDGSTWTCKSDLGIYYSTIDLNNKGWIYTTAKTMSFYRNYDPIGAFNLQNVNKYTALDDYCSILQLNNERGTWYSGCIMSRRPLMSIPTETVKETVSFSTSLGGVGYRSFYSHVREWHLDFVFDGISERDNVTTTFNIGDTMNKFLPAAEIGVTVYVDGVGTLATTDQTSILHTPNQRNYDATFFKGVPNMITGVLTDCQSVQIAPRDGKLMMHKVSMTIAEKLIPTS